MLRCKDSAGEFKVSLLVLHATEETRVQIMGHNPLFTTDGQLAEAPPSVSTKEPFVGELCIHEMVFLNSVPGKDYRPEYDFTVEELS